MKTLSLPQYNFNLLLRKNTNHTALSQSKVSTSTGGKQQRHTISAGKYIIDALGEGLKQNFLGADIDMEFLTLTLRSYATTTVNALRQLVIKSTDKQPNHNSI
jgi:hypothetical protein